MGIRADGLQPSSSIEVLIQTKPKIKQDLQCTTYEGELLVCSHDDDWLLFAPNLAKGTI